MKTTETLSPTQKHTIDIPIVNPQILSLITTDRCTATCNNCCFQCSPHNNQTMSLQDMINSIKESTQSFPSIISCVFTGGECTLLGKDLHEAIKYATSKNLKCRIVTNGHWAISKQCALSFLSQLKNEGLRELNLSTGDEHQQWIPYSRIVNACQAAVELNLFVAVNIESTPQSTFTSKAMINDCKLSRYITSGKIFVKDSLWIEFDKSPSLCYQNKTFNDGPCTNLFNTISISPDKHLQACCGLTCKNNRYLDLGDISLHSIQKLYREQFDDLLKLWLYTHGPKDIYSFLCKKKNIIDDSYHYPHICSLCHHILENKENMDLIRNDISSIIPSIILKYHFINQ